MNKVIDGKRCTIAWHVDDLKISHLHKAVVDKFLDDLSQEFGNEMPLTITWGSMHNYLRMKLEFSKQG